MATFYDVLGVARSASQRDIKSAYYRLALLHHPDRHRATRAAQVASVRSLPHRTSFQHIVEAYATLGNPSKRREYDLKHGLTRRILSRRTSTTYHSHHRSSKQGYHSGGVRYAYTGTGAWRYVNRSSTSTFSPSQASSKASQSTHERHGKRREAGPSLLERIEQMQHEHTRHRLGRVSAVSLLVAGVALFGFTLQHARQPPIRFQHVRHGG